MTRAGTAPKLAIARDKMRYLPCQDFNPELKSKINMFRWENNPKLYKIYFSQETPYEERIKEHLDFKIF